MNEYVRLIPADTPLIALAERLGYQVYLNNFEAPPEGSIAQYKVVATTMVADGDDLVDLLMSVIDFERGRRSTDGKRA